MCVHTRVRGSVKAHFFVVLSNALKDYGSPSQQSKVHLYLSTQLNISENLQI